MKRLNPSLLYIVFFSTTFSQIKYIPAPLSGEQIINHLGYSLSYNELHEQPNWIFYELNKYKISGSAKRKNQFKIDPNVKKGSAELIDYRGSGYDRGHLAPAGDMKWSEIAMQESFFMSNISPQYPGFNRGIWKKLEAQVRKWSKNRSVYIVTGGILKENLTTIGPNQVSVPKFFYKVIIAKEEFPLNGIGFVLPNKKSSKKLRDFAVSIDDVEELSGLDFFYLLPDTIEDRLESTFNYDYWSIQQSY